MVDFLITLAAMLAATGFLLALWRFLQGPTDTDRVVAFDTLTVIALTEIALIAYLEGRSIYLDVALVYALLSFLGVIVVARFLEKGL